MSPLLIALLNSFLLTFIFKSPWLNNVIERTDYVGRIARWLTSTNAYFITWLNVRMGTADLSHCHLVASIAQMRAVEEFDRLNKKRDVT